MFLMKMGTCAVVEDIMFRLEREFGHAPKSVAHAFADVWSSPPLGHPFLWQRWPNRVLKASLCSQRTVSQPEHNFG